MEPSNSKGGKTAFRCAAAVVALLTAFLVFILVYSVALSIRWEDFSMELNKSLTVSERNGETVCSTYHGRRAGVTEKDIRTVCTLISRGTVKGDRKPENAKEKLSLKFNNGEVLNVYGTEKDSAYIEYSGNEKSYRFLVGLSAGVDDIMETLESRNESRGKFVEIHKENSEK